MSPQTPAATNPAGHRVRARRPRIALSRWTRTSGSTPLLQTGWRPESLTARTIRVCLRTLTSVLTGRELRVAGEPSRARLVEPVVFPVRDVADFVLDPVVVPAGAYIAASCDCEDHETALSPVLGREGM